MTSRIFPLTAQFVSQALGLPASSDSTSFTRITTDSRKVIPGSLFIAVPGERFDGHAFIEQAMNTGATGIVCRTGTRVSRRAGVSIFTIPEDEGGPVTAYRKIAHSWRRQFSIPVICVAGSAGKTTTKEFLSAILHGKFAHVLKTEGSQNGFLGIPMTLLELNEKHQAAVVEVGIDEIGAMNQHLKLVEPTAATVTAIGPEHLEKLVDLPTVAKEEILALTEVAQTGKPVFINLDDPWLAPFFEKLAPQKPIGFGFNPNLPKTGTDRILSGAYNEETGILSCSGLGWNQEGFRTPLPGKHNALNLLGALVIARKHGLSADECRNGLSQFVGAKGRSEVHVLPGRITVLCDYYNAQPASMEAAFQTLQQLSRRRERFVCLADMLELGPKQEQFHRALADSLQNLGVEHVYLTGPNMKFLSDELKSRGFEGDLQHFSSQSELGRTLALSLKPDSAVLIKGSRGMKMEEVWTMISGTKILEPSEQTLRDAASALLSDDLVAMPTETVYGLAGNAFSNEALTRIFSSKERPTFDPLIVHVPLNWNSVDVLAAQGLVDLNLMTALARDRVTQLIRSFWPGPLTLVLPKTPRVPDLATSGLPTVAVRMPNHPVAQRLLSAAGVPLAAPSANRFGRISPTSAQDVLSELGGRITWILDGGKCEIGLESTVLAVSERGDLQLLRPGKVSMDQIQNATGAQVSMPGSGQNAGAQVSPGMLKNHYAPKKPLFILEKPVSAPGFQLDRKSCGISLDAPVGILLMSGSPEEARARLSSCLGFAGAVEIRSLSSTGKLEEIAKNLFSALRALDESPAEVLFVEPCPSTEGLGFAITDRLSRASAK